MITQPEGIERESFRVIGELLGEKSFPANQEGIVKRVIHTSADFDYVENLTFGDGSVEAGIAALREGAAVVTDTRMAYAGINGKNLTRLGAKKTCYIDHPRVVQMAAEKGVTRASIAMELAASDAANRIFVVGNAPTALISLYHLVKENRLKPALVVGVPVGFVNVVESKEMVMELPVPYIVARGRKGGSNVAAAIINGFMLEALK